MVTRSNNSHLNGTWLSNSHICLVISVSHLCFSLSLSLALFVFGPFVLCLTSCVVAPGTFLLVVHSDKWPAHAEQQRHEMKCSLCQLGMSHTHPCECKHSPTHPHCFSGSSHHFIHTLHTYNMVLIKATADNKSEKKITLNDEIRIGWLMIHYKRAAIWLACSISLTSFFLGCYVVKARHPTQHEQSYSTSASWP